MTDVRAEHFSEAGAATRADGLITQLSQTTWMPIKPGTSCASRQRDFHISMLLPGFAHAFHAHVLNRSLTSIAKYRTEAEAALLDDPKLQLAVSWRARELKPVDGLLMARMRGSCQLPFWSRLAIVQYRKEGFTIHQIAEAFMCSPRTVVNAATRTVFASSRRLLAPQQLHPPGKFKAREV